MTKLTSGIFLASLFVLCSCGGGGREDVRREPPAEAVKYYIAEERKALNRPYSDAVRVGNVLYLSGAIGTLPGTNDLAPGGVEAETRQTLENIKQAVEANGSSMNRVVKCTVMLADISEWDKMNAVYRTYFPDNRPARSSLGVSGLVQNARVEIECMAAVD